MITLILPGYSKHNQDWVMEAAKRLSVPGEIRPILWEHWTDESKSFVPAEKAKALVELIKNEKVNIIAKSLGTLVAMFLIHKIPGQIAKVILCGIPLSDIGEDEINVYKEVLLLVSPQNFLTIQNESDPHGSFSDAEELLHSINSSFIVLSKPAANHEYPYFEDFQKIISAN
jgi:predicted alpha/beta hydrolase family esterase